MSRSARSARSAAAGVALRLIASAVRLARAKESSTDVLIRLVGGPAPAQQPRPSLNVALCLDVSGSMGGDPLAQAKRAAQAIIARLTATDRFAVVTYSNQAQIVCESAMATETAKAKAVAALAGLCANGGTALHAGWLAAAQQCAPFVSDHGLSRVLLLSDGQANVGVVDTDQIASEAQRLHAAGIATSSYGVGPGFNETLMTRIAVGGQAFYASTSDQLCAYFDQDLNLMSSVCAKGVALTVTAVVDGHESAVETLNDLAPVDGAFRLTDVLFDGESWMVVRVAASPKESVEVRVRATCVINGAAVEVSDTVVLPVGDRAQKAGGTGAQMLTERVRELEAARIQREAMREAQRGNWAGVDTLVHQLGGMAGSNAYVASVANNLAQTSQLRDANLFSKQAVYASHTMSTRSASVHEDTTTLNDVLGLRKGDQGRAAPADASTPSST